MKTRKVCLICAAIAVVALICGSVFCYLGFIPNARYNARNSLASGEDVLVVGPVENKSPNSGINKSTGALMTESEAHTAEVNLGDSFGKVLSSSKGGRCYMEISTEICKKYGFTVAAGRLPSSPKEMAISVNFFDQYKASYPDNDALVAKKRPDEYVDVIGLIARGTGLTVVGVIDTGYKAGNVTSDYHNAWLVKADYLEALFSVYELRLQEAREISFEGRMAPYSLAVDRGTEVVFFGGRTALAQNEMVVEKRLLIGYLQGLALLYGYEGKNDYKIDEFTDELIVNMTNAFGEEPYPYNNGEIELMTIPYRLADKEVNLKVAGYYDAAKNSRMANYPILIDTGVFSSLGGDAEPEAYVTSMVAAPASKADRVKLFKGTEVNGKTIAALSTYDNTAYEKTAIGYRYAALACGLAFLALGIVCAVFVTRKAK